tara:strand:- start:296 stop:424 length:129 start_codon:yes stop_codon:yes gene_type:complete
MEVHGNPPATQIALVVLNLKITEVNSNHLKTRLIMLKDKEET